MLYVWIFLVVIIICVIVALLVRYAKKVKKEMDTTVSLMTTHIPDTKSRCPWCGGQLVIDKSKAKNIGDSLQKFGQCPHCFKDYGFHQDVSNELKVLEFLDKQLSIEPNNAQLWSGKGQIFEKINNYTEALKCYEKAARLGDGFANTKYRELKNKQ